MTIREALTTVVRHNDLTESQTRSVFDEIMSGRATSAQIGAFLTALRMKGETVAEITGAARAMRRKAQKVEAGRGLVDTCGTGGSGVNTFNISTAAAFVVAGNGQPVAKHGNRSASSHCGSADVLEALGVRIDGGPAVVRRSIREAGIGFLYAPLFHGAMKYAASPRREIGIRTIFNVLGPLCNPASADGQVIGVYDASLTDVVARVAGNLGVRRAFVVHGDDGLDEITSTGRTRVSELAGGRVRTYHLTPESVGLRRASLRSLRGGAARANARMVRAVLEGRSGPRRDIVLMNAAAALVAGGAARTLRDGVRGAAASIDSGRALRALEKLIEVTNR